MAWWHSGQGIGLKTRRLQQIWLVTISVSGNEFGQSVHTRLSLFRPAVLLSFVIIQDATLSLVIGVCF